MLRIYLAGAIAELDRVERWAAQVREAAGLELSHDWIAKVREAQRDGFRRDRELDDRTRARISEADLEGIRSADVCWLLAPQEGGVGCWIEFGYALARSKALVVSGDCRRTIFSSHAGLETGNDEIAFAAILKLSKRKG